MIKDLNFTNFNTELCNAWVLVDYWAHWCIPCQTQDPIIQNIATELEGKIQIFKVDINDNRVIADQQKVKNIPTLILYHNGMEVERFLGLQSKESILNNKHIKSIK